MLAAGCEDAVVLTLNHRLWAVPATRSRLSSIAASGLQVGREGRPTPTTRSRPAAWMGLVLTGTACVFLNNHCVVIKSAQSPSPPLASLSLVQILYMLSPGWCGSVD